MRHPSSPAVMERPPPPPHGVQIVRPTHDLRCMLAGCTQHGRQHWSTSSASPTTTVAIPVSEWETVGVGNWIWGLQTAQLP